MSAEQAIVLLIDPRDRSRRLLEHGLRKEGLEVEAFASAAEAAASATPRFGVAIVDASGEAAAVFGDVASLASVARRPMIAIAGEGEIEAAEKAGARVVVLRPARIRDLAPHVRTLAAEPDETLPTVAPLDVVSSEFTRDDLVALLDEIVLDERTGAIRVQAEGVIGTLYFRDGEMIDAVAGRATGQAAVNRLLYVDQGRYEALYVEELDRERTIEDSAADVLQDAEEYAGAFRDLASRLPSLDAIYTVSLRSITARAGQFPPETDQVVRLIDGHRSIREVIFASPVDDLLCLEILYALFEMGALVTADVEDEPEDLDDGFEQLRLSGSFRAVTGPSPVVEAESIAKEGRSALVVGSPRGFTGAHRAITGSLPAVPDVRSSEAAAEAERLRAIAAEREREASSARDAALAELQRQEDELAAARREEIEAAERRAEEVRREAEDRAERLRAREAEIARERMRLSGALPAIPDAQPGATPAEDPNRTLGLSSVAVATGAAAAHTTHSAGSQTLAQPAPDLGPAPSTIQVEDAFLASASDPAETDFFTSDHEATALDDPFAEADGQGANKGVWIIGGIILVAIAAIVLFSGDRPTQTTRPTAETPPTAAAETPAEVPAEPEAPEAEVDAEVVEPGPTPEELAAELRRARQETAADSRLLALDVVAEMRNVVLDVSSTVLPPIVPAATTERAPRERDPDRERTPRERDTAPAATSDRDVERAVRECALASSAGNYARTIELCEAAIRANPRSAESFTALGKAHYELGNNREAVQFLEGALRINSRDRTALVLLGTARQDMGNIAGAREAYERYLRLYPDGSRSNEIRSILESL